MAYRNHQPVLIGAAGPVAALRSCSVCMAVTPPSGLPDPPQASKEAHATLTAQRTNIHP